VVTERAQHAATEENTCKKEENTSILKKHHQFDNTYAADTHNTTKYRNSLEILTMQPNIETLCKYSQRNQIQKLAANTHNATK